MCRAHCARRTWRRRGLRARTRADTLCRVLLPVLPLLFVARGLSIEWQAPAECPSAEAVRSRVRDAVGRTSAGPDLTIRGVVTPLAPAGWRMLTTVYSQEFGSAPKPAVDAPTCAELADAFILFVTHSWTAAEPPPPPRVTWRMRVAGRGGYGLAGSRWYAGGQLVIGLVVGHLRVELGGAGVGGVRGAEEPVPGLGVQRWTLLLRACGEMAVRSLELRLCGGAEGGGIATGPAKGSSRWQPSAGTLDLHLAPALTWWVHPVLGVWVGLTGGVYLTHLNPKIGEEPSPKVPSPWVSAEGALGLEFRWGM